MREYEEQAPKHHPRPVTAEAATASGVPGVAQRDALTPAAVLHLQRTAGNASVVQLLGEDGEEERSPVKDVVESGGGRPLDDSTRTFMESRLGHDFGDVRIHDDAKASASAASVQANAYTVGTNVVFRSSEWSPETERGQRMLAHELTHVVQQKAGAVDGSPAAGGIRVSDPSDRFEREADQVADRVMSSNEAAPSPTGAAPASLQRQEAGEEEAEEVQGSFVQRQEEEVPEEETTEG